MKAPTFFSLVLLLLLTLATPAHALDLFKLSFTLTSDGTDVVFPEGVVKIVTVEARAQVLAESTVRFSFTKSTEITTSLNGKISRIFLSHLDVKLSPEDMAFFESLKAHTLDQVVVRSDGKLGMDDVVKNFASAQLKNDMAQRLSDLPRLLAFEGALSVGYISVGRLNEVQTSQLYVGLREVKSFNKDSGKIGLDEATLSTSKDEFMGPSKVSLLEERTLTYLSVLRRLWDLYFKIRPPMFGVTTINGQIFIEMYRPPESNVVRPVFGKSKCEDGLKE